MKKYISILIVLLLLCAGCAGTAPKAAETGKIEQVFELYQKTKQEALNLMGIKAEELVAASKEPGANYVADREEYENENLYLRLYFMEDEKVFGYQIRFYYPTGDKYKTDYDRLKAIVEEHCTSTDGGNIYTMKDGAMVRIALFQGEKTDTSGAANGLIFRLWKQPE